MIRNQQVKQYAVGLTSSYTEIGGFVIIVSAMVELRLYFSNLTFNLSFNYHVIYSLYGPLVHVDSYTTG